MSTGIESWKSLGDISVIYPFPGTEFVIFIIGFALWITWHVVQMRRENKHLDEAKRAYYKRKS